MDDLVQWFRAHLDADERIALEAEDWHPSPWCYGIAAMKRAAICDKDGREVLSFAHHYEPTKYAVAHIQRFTPAAVLADVAAKRAILDLHEAQDDPDAVRQGVKPYCQTCSEPLPWEHPDVVRNDLHPEPFDYPCPTLRLLASAYAHRPGYREEWRP